MRIITVRLSEEHQELLEEITKMLGTTRSDSIRYAIQLLHKVLTNHSRSNKVDLIEKILNGDISLELETKKP